MVKAAHKYRRFIASAIGFVVAVGVSLPVAAAYIRHVSETNRDIIEDSAVGDNNFDNYDNVEQIAMGTPINMVGITSINNITEHNAALNGRNYEAVSALGIDGPMAMEGSWSMGWESYKARFLSADGRIIDNGNNNISHTEGQGYGMLLSVAYDDPVAFARIWRWTRINLRLRNDGLFSWRYDPMTESPVEDLNAAADGDLLIAWALERAGERWHNDAYIEEAREISALIREHLILEFAGHLILMPGIEWDTRTDDRMVFNLSYWIYPAFRDLNRIDPSPVWHGLELSGLELLEKSGLGDDGLPPDWLVMNSAGEISYAEEMGTNFGYNNIRIPLYLIWAGIGNSDNLLPFSEFWLGNMEADLPPMEADMKTGEVISEMTDASYYRIVELTECTRLSVANRHENGFIRANTENIPNLHRRLTDLDELSNSSSDLSTNNPSDIGEYYYGATMELMVDIVAKERDLLCQN